MTKPDDLAAVPRPSEFESLARFQRDAVYRERTSRLVENLERGARVTQTLDRAYGTLISHLRKVGKLDRVIELDMAGAAEQARLVAGLVQHLQPLQRAVPEHLVAAP